MSQWKWHPGWRFLCFYPQYITHTCYLGLLPCLKACDQPWSLQNNHNFLFPTYCLLSLGSEQSEVTDDLNDRIVNVMAVRMGNETGEIEFNAVYEPRQMTVNFIMTSVVWCRWQRSWGVAHRCCQLQSLSRLSQQNPEALINLQGKESQWEQPIIIQISTISLSVQTRAKTTPHQVFSQTRASVSIHQISPLLIRRPYNNKKCP